MKKVLFVTTVTLSLGMGASALAAPEGTVLFTQKGSQIIAENGLTRPARQGDVLQSGERLLTPPGSISQVRLPDGSLMGLRPGTEIKFDKPAPGVEKTAIVSLQQGSVRVIGAELMDPRKSSALTIQSGQATLKLQGADLETTLVKPDANKPPGGNDAGSYNRLLVGTGSIGSGATVTPLEPRQESFVGGDNTPPIIVSRFPLAPIGPKRPDTTKLPDGPGPFPPQVPKNPGPGPIWAPPPIYTPPLIQYKPFILTCTIKGTC
jgi:hypothetical protein